MRKRIIPCILAALLLFSLPLVSAGAAYAPDLTVFGGTASSLFVTNNILGMELIFPQVDSALWRNRAVYLSGLTKQPDFVPTLTALPEDVRNHITEDLMPQVSQYGDRQQFDKAVAVLLEVFDLLGIPVDLNEVNTSAMTRHLASLEQIINAVVDLNMDSVEEYVGWCYFEMEKGTLDFSRYIADAEAIHAAGKYYVAYPWLQYLPKWYRDGDDAVLGRDVLTGGETLQMSIFAQETLDMYDRLYAALAEAMGDQIDILRIGVPYGFGETAYPCGTGDDQFQFEGGMGYWCDEAPARAHFKNWAEQKYGSIAAANAAWGTNFTGFSTITYPIDGMTKDTLSTAVPAGSDRCLLDFITWYNEALIEQFGKIIDIAQKYFPNTPMTFSQACPHEKVYVGQDIPGLVKLAADKGTAVRLPTGASVPFIYTMRGTTAARHYEPLKLAHHPVNSTANLPNVAMMLFKSLTRGSDWVVEYSNNLVTAGDKWPQYLDLWRNEYPLIEAALYYPTTSHYLANWNVIGAGIGDFVGGNPEGLQQYAETLRRMTDYDVIDERLIGDGFLGEYKYLIWPTGKVAEAETLQKIADWVSAGGTLLINDIEKVRLVEGGLGAFQGICDVAKVDGVRNVGKGQVIDISDDVKDLAGKYPGQLDTPDDAVLQSYFSDGVLVYNSSAEPIEKVITRSGQTFPVSLDAYEIRYIGTKNTNPNDLTRGGIIEALYKHAGSPDVSNLDNPFSDVPASASYLNAVKWGYANGIVTGSGGKYKPNDVIIRQDLALIVMRYVEFAKLDFPKIRDYAGFSDEKQIGSYALTAVKWFYEVGVINGKPGSLFDPLGVATNNEIALVIGRLK